MTRNLSDICIYNAKLEGKGFVGLVFENGDLKVYFPLGYRSADNDDERRRDILNLISVLSSFMEKDSSVDTYKSENKKPESGFPIQAYLRVISDFLVHGYYRETETVYSKSHSGKIDWKKTIKTIQPALVGDNLIFLDFISRRSLNNENELISQIHKYCVHEAFLRIGSIIFPSFLPEKPQIEYNQQLFKSVINLKLSRTFNERNIILFNDMKLIIDNLDSSGSCKRNCRYGTEEFEYVWERLVDHVYGVPNKGNYYPHTEWHIGGKIFDDSDVDYKKNALRPDTIMLVDDDVNKEVFVLDSKYYKYGKQRSASLLPGTDSIIKQIAYGKYVENNKEHPELRVKGDSIFNAFILPFDSQSGNLPEVFGFAQTTYEKNDKPYHKVFGVLLDLKDLMYHHAYHDKGKISILAKTITDYAETISS